MKTIDIRKIIARFRLFFDRDPQKIESNPKRDWTTLFLLFCVAVGVSGVLHYFLYVHFVTISQEIHTLEGQNIQTIDKADLEKTINEYEAREATFNRLMSDRPTYRDPSR